MAMPITDASSLAAREDTPLEQCHRTFSETQELTHLIISMVDELCGVVPTEVDGISKSAATSMQPGTLQQVADHARSTLVQVGRANDAMRRLGRLTKVG